ncbi:hypothetical protein BGY98DRAFT_462714 [Russula aff. rugulosa BPL654]|nr:hypothetical protein BGY98DRAFT_462714 [Russula aff. rugulosa BPL654]
MTDSHMENLPCPVTVFMSCPTKNAKVISISFSSLHRLIALCAVSLSAIPAVIQTINDCMSQGVDIHLKILQTPLPHDQLCYHSRQTIRKPARIEDGCGAVHGGGDTAPIGHVRRQQRS